MSNWDRALDYDVAKTWREPAGPWSVEFRAGKDWDLWQGEIEDYQDAVSEAQILENHGVQWRIFDGAGEQHSPNLRPRTRRVG